MNCFVAASSHTTQHSIQSCISHVLVAERRAEMSTTQILFNSPALHSLKREQLVKLCKIHSIKANGKNAELIERLKQRAQEFPRDEDDVDRRQEQQEEVHVGGLSLPGACEAPKLQMPRPSEQWEVVMEDIPEVYESSSLGTISSKGSLRTQGGAGEFGTGNSKSELFIHVPSMPPYLVW